MKDLQPKPLASASASRLTVYFFRGNLWYVRLLQLLVGGSWHSPTHVVYSLDRTSYEITTKGVVVGESSPEALYRACQDCFSFDLSPVQALVLHSYFRGLRETGARFRVVDCIRFCWSLLTTGWGSVYVWWEALTYGQVVRVQPFETDYCPPFSCTTPMWDVLGLQEPSWNAFVPAALYSQLTGSVLVETEDF